MKLLLICQLKNRTNICGILGTFSGYVNLNKGMPKTINKVNDPQTIRVEILNTEDFSQLKHS